MLNLLIISRTGLELILSYHAEFLQFFEENRFPLQRLNLTLRDEKNLFPPVVRNWLLISLNCPNKFDIFNQIRPISSIIETTYPPDGLGDRFARLSISSCQFYLNRGRSALSHPGTDRLESQASSRRSSIDCDTLRRSDLVVGLWRSASFG